MKTDPYFSKRREYPLRKSFTAAYYELGQVASENWDTLIVIKQFSLSTVISYSFI